MNEKITLHTVYCLITMLQITISTINLKAMIGFSDVQELVSFFKIFALRKGHLRETKKKCSGIIQHFEIELIFF